MDVVVLDSGMGGLEVAARLYERSLREELAVRVRFVNVRPPPGHRFEGRCSDAQKLGLFAEMLRAVEGALAIDLIALACNSLSALVSQSELHARVGSRMVLLEPLSDHQHLPGDAEVFVFGTELTIRRGAHRRALLAGGIPEAQIIEQACPGLANSIQDGHASEQTTDLLAASISEALSRRRSGFSKAVVLLACSHYSYLRERFREALLAGGLHSVNVVCANDSMVEALVQQVRARGPNRLPPSISLYTLHPLTADERDNFVELLTPISPETAMRLGDITHLGTVARLSSPSTR